MRLILAIALMGIFAYTASAQPIAQAQTETPTVVEEPVFEILTAKKQVVKIQDTNEKGFGTGFAVSDNLIVTAYHVTTMTKMKRVAGMVYPETTDLNHVLVTNYARKRVVGEVIYRDKENDIAFVRLLDELEVETVTLTTSARIREPVHSVGHPLGFGWVVMDGTFLAHPERKGRTKNRAYATINGATSGTSGGPIFNEKGEVLGVLVAMPTLGDGVLFVPTRVFKGAVDERL